MKPLHSVYSCLLGPAGRRTLGPLVGLLMAAFALPAGSEPSFAVRQRALLSVVRVTANNCADDVARSGSGFTLEQAGQIVTAHHVVGGCKTVLVRYEGAPAGTSAVRNASVVRVLPKGDLALLRVTDPPPSVPSLKRASSPLTDRGNAFFGFGYQNGQISASDVEVRFAAGVTPLELILTPPIVDEMRKIQSPIDLHRDVLRFGSPLQPGMSGGPIIDTNGAVIGIVAGGLKAGAAPASWGWPSEWITELLVSTAATDQAISVGRAYYSLSELDAGRLQRGKNRRLQCGSLDMLYVGRKSFDEVEAGADDRPRVEFLKRLSRMDNAQLSALAFDIWVHEASGATAVTPAGYELRPVGGACVAVSADGNFQQAIWGAAASGEMQVQQVSLQFEDQVMRPRVPQMGFSIDQGLTTFTPMGLPGPLPRDNGLIFNRKGFNHPKMQYFGAGTPMAHSFETLIAKAGTFLGVGTVNGEVHPQLQRCLAVGIGSMGCESARRHLDQWTHFVLATQLSTYPTY